jgi:hypothetical protein
MVGLGLNMLLDVNFTAKRETGRVSAQIDNKQLANDIMAKVNGKYKEIAAADLKSLVAKSLNSSSAIITVEGGDAHKELYNVAERVIMGVLNVGGFGSAGGSGTGYNDWFGGGGNNGGGWGSNYGSGSGNSTIDKFRSRPGGIYDRGTNNGGGSGWGSGNSGGFGGGGVNNSGGYGNGNGGGETPVKGNMVNVKHFADMLRDTKEMSFSYVLMGSAQSFNYRTGSLMRLNIGDLFLKENKLLYN